MNSLDCVQIPRQLLIISALLLVTNAKQATSCQRITQLL